MAETINQVIARVSSRISGNIPGVNVNPGSSAFDMFIDPMSNEIVRQEIIADYSAALQYPNGVLALESDANSITLIATAKNTTSAVIQAELSSAIDALASNVNLTRNGAINANGFVQFARATALGASDDFTIPQGTKVQTAGGVQFVTTQSIRTTLAIGNTVPIAGGYGLTVPVVSVVAGSAGNVPENSIVQIVTAVPGFTAVSNPSDISNGVDAETDAALAARIALVWQGNNVGTRIGYQQFILNTGQVTDTIVVGAGDPLMLRDNGYGGCVDIYILEENLKQISEAVTVPPSGLVPLTYQPVRSIVSPAGFAVNKDLSVYGGSDRASDTAVWVGPGTAPTGSFTMTYIYNQNPLLIQALLTGDKIALDNDVLIKESNKILVDITARISILPAFNFASVQASIMAGVAAYIDALAIGATLDADQVFEIIDNTRGVFQTILPLDIFNREDSLALTPPTLFVNTIPCAAREFLRLGNLVINQI